MAEEVVDEYRSSLADLKMNSKPLINMLTMLAEENKQYAGQFVEVIEDRVLKAPPSEKLPTMYLIDSIIKNLSDSNYLQLFSKNIVTTFAAVFEKVDEKTRSALFKLRHTWNDLFPMKILYSLDLGVREIDPAWPVLPGAKIHVNPKFLPQVQQDPEKEEEKVEAACHEASEQIAHSELEQLKLEKENRDSCVQLENDILLKKQLMAKQQEILKLHQQRLELELAKARSQIELQARLLQKEKDTVKEMQAKEAAPNTKANEVVTTKLTTSATAKSVAGASSVRDPRIRPTAQIKGDQSAAALSQQTAVVLPTPVKPVSEAVVANQESPATIQGSSKVIPNLAGNIFDRLQDITPKSKQTTSAKTSATTTEKGPLSASTQEEPTRNLKGRVTNTDKKSDKVHSPLTKRDSVKSNSTDSKANPQNKKTDNHGRKKNSRGSQMSNSPGYKSPLEDRSRKDSNARQKRPLKGSRNRSSGSSDVPAKFAKRGDQSSHGPHFKSGVMARGLRRNSIREDGPLVRGRVQGHEKRHHDSSRKRPLEDDPMASKGTKKVKPLNELDVKESHQLSDDLIELFGKEDKDYRCLPTTDMSASDTNADPSGFKGMAMGPHRRRDSLLLLPSVPSSQSSGWAQFKASRPEDFPFQHSQARSHRDSLDTDIRSMMHVSPGIKLIGGRRAPLLPTPNLDDTPDSANANLLSTVNSSGQVTMDTLEKQMNELHRLQDMKRNLDEQRDRLLGNSIVPPFNGGPGLGSADPQFSELHRLQNLKRDLDEKQERLQAMIDSGMKISDEFNSAFPALSNISQNVHPVPMIRNKRLDVHDESSRPLQENLLRRNADNGYYPEERTGLLGNRTLLPDPHIERRGDETKALLPTPFLDRDGGKNMLGPVLPAPSRHSVPQEVDLPCEDEHLYYPEHDSRWSMRVQMQRSRSANVYNVVIDGKHYEMMFTNRPLKIWLDRHEMVIRLDPNSRKLWCNDTAIYHIGEEEKTVALNGKKHLVFVQGPLRKLWIDNQLFDIGLDSPPEKINIGGKEHQICIDGGKNHIFVDGFDICPFGTDEPQLVQLAFVMHTIQFHPPCKQILIDDNLCNLDLAGKYPVVIIDGKARGIRFDGPPQIIYIDDKAWTIPVDRARRCHLDGPSSKPVVLALGGPGHEVIVDDQWYELKFGGVEKYIKVGRKMRKFQLKGSPPEVKILGEIALMKPDNVNSPGKTMMHDGFMSHPERQPMLPGFTPQTLRHVSPDIAHLPESKDNIPSLLDISVGPRMERNRSFGQFPGSRLEEVVQSEGNSDRHKQGHGSLDGFQTAGPHGSRSMEVSFGLGSYEPSRDPDGAVRGPKYGGQNPRQRLPPRNEFGRIETHEQPGHNQNMSFMNQGPQQMRMMQPANQSRPLLGPPYPGPHHPGQTFNQFAYSGNPLQMQAPWNKEEVYATPTADLKEGSSSDVQQPQVDVNNLLSKLLAAGLIKKTSENDASAVPASTSDQQSTAAAAAEEKPEAKALDSAGSEEQKEEAKKEEESVENIPDLTDFNLDNLKKRYFGAIQRVYLGVQCQTCGIRFMSDAMDRYNEHLDWHFRKNRREKEEMKVAKFRRWYYDFVDWIQFEEMTSAEDRLQQANTLDSMEPSSVNRIIESQASNIISCPTASRNGKEDICDTCRESFEQFWDEEREAWHLKDAIQVDEKLYHPICYEDAREVLVAGALVSEEEMGAVEMPSNSESLETQVNDVDMKEITTVKAPDHDEIDAEKEILPAALDIHPTETETQCKTEPEILEKTESLMSIRTEPDPESTLEDKCTPVLQEPSLLPKDDEENLIKTQECENVPDCEHPETVASNCEDKNESI